jgi:Cell Wall Hydrolase
MPKETWGDLESSFGEMPKALPMTAKARDFAARTLLSEAGGKDPLSQAAVMHVIRNRALRGDFGEGVEGVITKPYAFEPWLHAGTGRRGDPLAHSAESPEYQQALRIVDAVAQGRIPDPTKGATHFYSPSAQRQLASIDNRQLVPSWATKDAYKTTIGGQEFYTPAGGGGGGGNRVITISRPGEQVAEGYQAPDWLQSAEEERAARAQGAQQSADFMLKAQEDLAKRSALKPVEVALPKGGMQAPEAWGPMRSFATGVTLGALPKMEAGLEAAGSYLTGQVPSFLQERERRLGELQAGREAYQQYAPITHMVAEQAGALAGAALPMGLGERAIVKGGELLAGVVPEIRPALEAAGRFVSGKTAATAPGPMAAIPRAASYATQGALQGAGYGALTQGLQPEGTTLPEAIGTGAVGGAIASSLVNPFVSSLAAPLTAEIMPGLRSMAQSANQKFGLNIRPTQIARDPEILALDARVIPAHVRDEQVLKFNSHLADQVGMRGQELTKQNVETAMRKEGQALSDIAATTSMTPRRDFFRDLGDIRADVYATTLPGNPLRAKVDQILMKIYNETTTGVMDGNKFRAFVKKGGLLDKELLSSTDPSFRQAGYELKAKMFDMFSVSDGKKAAAYDRARENYRKLLAIEPLTSNSGIVDPTKVLKRASKFNLRGDFAELAAAGQHLPGTTSTGGAKAATKGPIPEAAAKLMDAAKLLGPFGIPSVAGYMGLSPEVAGAGAALLGGGQYVGSRLRDWAMASPAVGRAVLSGRMPNVVTPMENLLARGAAGMATEVGAGKGR